MEKIKLKDYINKPVIALNVSGTIGVVADFLFDKKLRRTSSMLIEIKEEYLSNLKNLLGEMFEACKQLKSGYALLRMSSIHNIGTDAVVIKTLRPLKPVPENLVSPYNLSVFNSLGKYLGAISDIDLENRLTERIEVTLERKRTNYSKERIIGATDAVILREAAPQKKKPKAPPKPIAVVAPVIPTEPIIPTPPIVPTEPIPTPVPTPQPQPIIIHKEIEPTPEPTFIQPQPIHPTPQHIPEPTFIQPQPTPNIIHQPQPIEQPFTEQTETQQPLPVFIPMPAPRPALTPSSYPQHLSSITKSPTTRISVPERNIRTNAIIFDANLSPRTTIQQPRILGEFKFLLRRQVNKDIYNTGGRLVITKGTIINDEVVKTAKQNGRLIELTRASLN
ncbi:MAG: hypothetical protein FWB72_00765 [Firmicutes bacterium]|nr:hypothetical protein [Bacillota bacterium]